MRGRTGIWRSPPAALSFAEQNRPDRVLVRGYLSDLAVLPQAVADRLPHENLIATALTTALLSRRCPTALAAYCEPPNNNSDSIILNHTFLTFSLLSTASAHLPLVTRRVWVVIVGADDEINSINLCMTIRDAFARPTVTATAIATATGVSDSVFRRRRRSQLPASRSRREGWRLGQASCGQILCSR